MSIGNSYPDYQQREKRITKRATYSVSLLTSKKAEQSPGSSSRSGRRNKNNYSNQGAERMKKLLITLLLISPFSFADWDDVYYCQMTTYSGVSLEGKRTNYILEKFQFKLDEAKNAMVFGSSGVFAGSVIKLSDGRVWPAQETWYSNTAYSR